MARSLPLPALLQRSDRGDALLLGLRLLLAADLARLAFYRWSAFETSRQMLEVEGFPAPTLWLAAALLAGGISVASFVLGWRVRWGAALALLVFMPVATAFSVTYVPMGWSPWVGTALLALVLADVLALGFALTALFFFGAGRYTAARGLRAGNRWLCSRTAHVCFDQLLGRREKQTARR
jgi:hypothetical protein